MRRALTGPGASLRARPFVAGLLAWVGAAAVTAACAQSAIFTCVDSAGRRITADRPIPECLDRTQTELNGSGTVRRTHGPSLTEAERAAQEEQARREQLDRQRLLQERSRQRALLARFPDAAALEREQALALAPLEAVVATARQRLGLLSAQPATAAGSAAAPAASQGLQEQRRAQERFIQDKEAERERVRLRFADMRRELEALWSAPPGALR